MMESMKVLVCLLAVAATGLLLTRPVGAQEMPEGKGKELVVSLCSGCHGLEQVTSQRANKEGWETIVDYMVSRGMSATDEEYNTVVAYLAAAFPQAPAKGKGK
jgi:hypothetical protein